MSNEKSYSKKYAGNMADLLSNRCPWRVHHIVAYVDAAICISQAGSQ